MKNKKTNFYFSMILILLSIIFTVLSKIIDVKKIGPNDTSVGFATINQFVSSAVGFNDTWYSITEWLGIFPVLIAVFYVIIGFVQLIKRKSVFKVDKEIILLGALYIVVFGLYMFFEKIIINYRPVLMEGILESSYPSSHTLMAVCICGSSIIVNKKVFNNKISNIANILSTFIAFAVVLGRLISGVHWFTDILGGLLISSSLLMTYYSIIQISKITN